MRAGQCVGVLEPDISAFCFDPLAVAAAVSCRLHHTVPQALKLSTWWQPRYNSSRTARLCAPLRTIRVLTAYACVLGVL